ncbi:transglutaminase family protein [Desulfitobacterium sp. PCE1]|uniref:transglutaminase-like domain-containing protein n=1 Tax=Desulfitobacterium sp. PCE1 TaxID=146907 RepID=UPI00035CCAD7|nr:transglutaminase-like domain-containing protein [Desulfitobacterium sp. PCE1]
MKRRLLLCIAAFVIWIMAGASEVFAADYFNTSDIGKGVIRITYDGGGKTKVMIQKEDEKYTYDINSSGKTESYPLQFGDGTYKISLLANTSGNSYKLIASKSVDVKITNPNSVYLTSIQTINWNVDSKAVAKAAELTKDIDDLGKKATVLWDYMVKNNSYDYNKLATLSTDYLPVIDQTLAEKKGICYDFSSLYAAMLRSQGKPAKLVKGYAPKNAAGYHAWNEVYDESKGQWIVIDTTYDLQVIAKNPKITMVKNAKDFNKVYEY